MLTNINEQRNRAEVLLVSALNSANEKELEEIYQAFDDRIKAHEEKQQELDRLQSKTTYLKNSAIFYLCFSGLSALGTIAYPLVKPLTYLVQIQTAEHNLKSSLLNMSNANLIELLKLIPGPALVDFLVIASSCSALFFFMRKLEQIRTEVQDSGHRINQLTLYAEEEKELILDLRQINEKINEKLHPARMEQVQQYLADLDLIIKELEPLVTSIAPAINFFKLDSSSNANQENHSEEAGSTISLQENLRLN